MRNNDSPILNDIFELFQFLRAISSETYRILIQMGSYISDIFFRYFVLSFVVLEYGLCENAAKNVWDRVKGNGQVQGWHFLKTNIFTNINIRGLVLFFLSFDRDL